MRHATVFLILSSLAPVFAEDPPKPTEADAKAKIDAISEAFKGGDAAVIKDAIKAAGECPHLKVIVALQGIILSGNPEDWRSAAASALGRMKDNVDAADALNATIPKTASNITVFRAVCSAIQEQAHRSSIAAIATFVRARVSKHEKDDLNAIDAAIDAMAAISTKSSVEAVLDVWHKCKFSGRDPNQNFKEKVAQSCRAAMRRLTGEKLDNFVEWDDWWEHEKGKLNDDLSRK
ncbi:MAG: hypothetical protein FD180_4124 [Planctomycetota bacterium]|nr:MAG: hypothetical protein FD180_4124 [Planctomycetota bacterium]